jgi:SP family general alpha glucoside:H+ symporter-like MFS transporter
VDADNTIAMMKRTIDIEAESKAGSSYIGCFRGANLRRTEVACVAWAVTIWSGSSFANHPSYFFVQAGMTPKQAISMDLGIRGVAFVATGLAWVNLSVSRAVTWLMTVDGSAHHVCWRDVCAICSVSYLSLRV